VTRYQPLWEQAGSYAASQDRSLLGALWPSGGIVAPAPAAVANTMNMQIGPGTAVVQLQAGQGCALCRWDAIADSTVTLATAPPSGQSRIDLYCIQVRDNALDSGGNNDFIFSAVTGTPAASNPAVPATPTNAMALAQVTVPGAAANLNTATVTDVRPYGLGQVQPYSYVYRAAAYTDVNTTLTTCPFDTVVSDNVGNRWTGLGTTSALYSVIRAGLYSVSAGWGRQTGLANGHQMETYLINNGAQVMLGSASNWSAYGIIQSDVAGYLRCNVGDHIQIAYIDYGGGGAQTAQNAAYCQILRVGE
jgi:hypothetical protein